MELSVSQVIDRPPNVVLDFIAVNHLRNHPGGTRKWNSGR